MNINIMGEKIQSPLVASSTDEYLELENSFLLQGVNRGGGETHAIEFSQNKVLELIFEDDTVWFCNSDTIEEVFQEATIQSRTANATFELPHMLKSNESNRSLVTSVLIKTVNIFIKKSVDKKVSELAAELEKRQLENQSGLYILEKKFLLRNYRKEASETPILLFIHGTASSTSGSFRGFSEAPVWESLHSSYSNILAFQHETLTKSPLENALTLIEKLPDNCELHIVSHSRGGLIGDILSRYSTVDEKVSGFDVNELAYLKKMNRTRDIEVIAELTKAISNKRIRVTKFIRVACPASGTILTSKRLDSFLNITLNLIGLGTGILAASVYSAFKNLIAITLSTRNEVNCLPGLEAMNPDSDFIKVLNNPISQVVIDKPLFVISGNCRIHISLKALVIICSRFFYWQDNDLVVNTSSMYQGSKRAVSGQFLFDQSIETDHFSYFSNPAIQEAVKRALNSKGTDAVQGFKFLEQASHIRGERNITLGLEGGQIFKDKVTGSKPIAVLLPGIMGSNLGGKEYLIWINYLRFITGELVELDICKNKITKAPSLVASSYSQLVNFLSLTYDVVTFPFDWRKDMNSCAAVFKEKIEHLLTFNQPIKIIGHSMGGVLVRDFIIQYPETWKLLNGRYGFRLLFLGTPLGGSFRIPAVLFGQDAIIKKLSKIDIFHSKKELINVFRRFPGLLALLPLSQAVGNDFTQEDTWSKMSEGLDSWPTPEGKDLTDFKNYRDFILNKSSQIDYTNIVYIAGKAKATVCAYEMVNGELVFLSTAEGDQSVTWETGIPKKLISNDSVYYVNVTHGSLANEPGIFKGMAEILEQGSTVLLSRQRPEIRVADRLFRMPEPEDHDISAEGLERTLLDFGESENLNVPVSPLTVSISNGDLRYSSYPVMVGHFKNDGIIYAEKEIDKNLKGALSKRLKLNLYPADIGTSEVIITRDENFPGTIIIGLGDYSTFSAFQLTKTVEQGVSRYLLKLNHDALDLPDKKNLHRVGISLLLIGSGYGGLSVDTCVQAILQGVQYANQKIQAIQSTSSRFIEFVEFIELYEDRALSCFYSLTRLEKEQDRGLLLAFPTKNINTILGAKTRITSEKVDGWWTRITVRLVNQIRRGNTQWRMSFNISTGGGREEQRELFSSIKLIDQLVEDISMNISWSPELARTIFELLIPNDFKDQLKKHRNIVWILDKYTASFPWELLQDSANDAKPLCVNAGMIRQLATEDYRLKINNVFAKSALVIGDPELNGFVNQLPGAYREAKIVSTLLAKKGFQTNASIKGSSKEIIRHLFSKDYKLIHLCGHGVFDPENPEKSGMLIGENVYLTPFEICQMSTVPELVIVNCCYLGQTKGIAEKLFRNRYKMAANIGTQLIENGVKAVIVAGWAVDDMAALEFTEAFYKYMFDGYTFGAAINTARQIIYNKFNNNNNTWGAYQCYGDPFYKLENNLEIEKEEDISFDFAIAKEAEVELFNLKNQLQSNSRSFKDNLNRLKAISKAVDNAGIRNSVITENEALVYAELGEYQEAVKLIERLLNAEKQDFSVSTIERFLNIKAKKQMLDLRNNGSDLSLRVSLDAINEIIRQVEALLVLANTAQRLSLLASIYKCKALISIPCAEKIKWYKAAAYYYYCACTIDENCANSYEFTSWIQLEALLVHSGEREWGAVVQYDGKEYALPSEDHVVEKLQLLLSTQASNTSRIDFKNQIIKANILVCLILINPGLLSNHEDWQNAFFNYRNFWLKAGSKGQKYSEIFDIDFLLDGINSNGQDHLNTLLQELKSLKIQFENTL